MLASELSAFSGLQIFWNFLNANVVQHKVSNNDIEFHFPYGERKLYRNVKNDHSIIADIVAEN